MAQEKFFHFLNFDDLCASVIFSKKKKKIREQKWQNIYKVGLIFFEVFLPATVLPTFLLAVKKPTIVYFSLEILYVYVKLWLLNYYGKELCSLPLLLIL